MWRSLFLAVAVSLCIMGAECLVIQKAVMAKEVPAPPPAASPYDYLDPLLPQNSGPTTMNPVIQPPECAPWSLLSAGVVVLLYALSLKRAA